MTWWKGDSLFCHKRKPIANKGAFTNLGASNQRQRIKWKYAIMVNTSIQAELYSYSSPEEMPKDEVIGEIEVSPLDSCLPPLRLGFGGHIYRILQSRRKCAYCEILEQFT